MLSKSKDAWPDQGRCHWLVKMNANNERNIWNSVVILPAIFPVVMIIGMLSKSKDAWPDQGRCQWLVIMNANEKRKHLKFCRIYKTFIFYIHSIKLIQCTVYNFKMYIPIFYLQLSQHLFTFMQQIYACYIFTINARKYNTSDTIKERNNIWLLRNINEEFYIINDMYRRLFYQMITEIDNEKCVECIQFQASRCSCQLSTFTVPAIHQPYLTLTPMAIS